MFLEMQRGSFIMASLKTTKFLNTPHAPLDIWELKV